MRVIVMTSSIDPPHAPSSDRAPAPTPHPARTSAALLVVLFASFIDLVDATIVVVAAPAIEASIGAGDAELQWIVAAYALALGAGLITAGRLGDRYGRKRIFLLGLAAFAVTSALCATASTPEVLIGFRAAQGLAAGIMVPQVFGIIRGSFPPARQAAAFGAYGAVQGLAAIAGPLLGGLLVDADLLGLGWRSIFWVNVPLCLIALVVGLRVLPESHAGEGSRVDVLGALLAPLGVLLLLLPLIQAGSWGWAPSSVALLVAGVLVLVAFLLHERRLAARGGAPVFDPALLRVRAFSAGLIAATLFFSGIGSLFLMLSVYLQAGAGRTAVETGLAFLPYAIGSMITSGVGIAVAARAGRLLLVLGSLIIAGSYLMLAGAVSGGEDPGYWSLAAALFVGGLGLGLVVPILVSVVLAGVPGRDAGAAGGALSTVIQIGGAIGIATLATAFFSLAGSVGGTPPSLAEYGPALGSVLLASAAVYVLAAGAMMLLPRAARASH